MVLLAWNLGDKLIVRWLCMNFTDKMTTFDGKHSLTYSNRAHPRDQPWGASPHPGRLFLSPADLPTGAGADHVTWWFTVHRFRKENVSEELRNLRPWISFFQGMTFRGAGGRKHLRVRGNGYYASPSFQIRNRFNLPFPSWVRKIKWYKIQSIPMPRGMTITKPLGDANWILSD